MSRLYLLVILLFEAAFASAQGVVKGRVHDKNSDEPLGYVNVVVNNAAGKMVKGAITDEKGTFTINDVPNGNYTLVVSFVGYKTLTRNFTLSAAHPTHNFNALYLSEDAQQLKEVTVTGQRAIMKLEVDRKTFDVTQDIANAGGSASDVLENIPSVEVDNDGNVSLRGNTSVEVWINGKASGLTSDNRAEILQQLPAESIERIEVIDNPSAKFSAEGSAGIINIILKKDRRAGYFGSAQVGGSTIGAANTSFNINYNSPLFDAFANVGYRHRHNEGESISRQEYLKTNTYQNYNGSSSGQGNNLFMRGGITLHASKNDDISLTGMLMHGQNKNWSHTPYHYGVIGQAQDQRLMFRRTSSKGDMDMRNVEFDYRHNFGSDRHFLDFVVNYGRWGGDNNNVYQDSTVNYIDGTTTYDYLSRPLDMNNKHWEVKLDYENPISEKLMLQAGYNARLSHENTPQESFADSTSWAGTNLKEDKKYFNRFIYDMDVHALYATLNYKLGKLGIMAGLRGEYWKVNTKSYDWDQEHDATKRLAPFKKDYFQLFPSLFLSYQLTDNDQLQLNYTRRLRRPWGGQLNSFRNTSDASTVSFGNPLLTPEYSNSFSLNYLRTWTQHSLLVSAYYRPTTDVMQRINWQNADDGLMYSTTENVAKSTSSGLELTAKNKFFKILDLSTTANFYYYKLDGFTYIIDNQTVTGQGNHNFTWNARMQASLRLPYDISLQTTFNYRSRQVISQGHRKAVYGIDFGARKNFFDKRLTVSLSCRDLLDSRQWENYTSSDTFTRYQKNRRQSRNFRLTLTWNFGNMKQKKNNREDGERGEQGEQGEQDNDMQNSFGGGDME
ncbi:MAG: TonB-dependent receptor [Prevotella sp.]|nr:TonB-dependent receptor [Prevotella sp.]